ncbi:MAG TPA: beta-L-arabinofuranosidase domain-containing protein [Pyrinomonadaceae bacterium]|nr:beta-L-arabinofuranosidase domain-containing protein [Pyrinomonadaceae bacterium]
MFEILIDRRTILPLRMLVASLVLASTASAQQIKNASPYVAQPLPLSAVRLTGGPLKHAQDLDAEFLLKLEPDRMLAYYRKQAGLAPKAPGLTGWDGDGRNLTGHIAGHYLSAVSLMYAATGDQRFKACADYIVKELKEVQDKNGDGFAVALEGVREKFKEVAAGNIRSTFFDLNGLWSPWYTLHKTFAGLRDAYRYTGNRDALQVEIKFAAWAETILLKLDDAQTQKMLNTEFGGMNEVLADLYADTGDKRWLALSHHFDHRAVIDPLARHQDILSGLHGNTQVPKLLGLLMRYIYAGDKSDGEAAAFFWDAVALHHSYATGGHGRDEYFGPPDQLSERVDGRTDESCNVYNMLKMTRSLFALHPDIKYAEFEERALFNHVLGSIDPEDGRTCYMVPVGRGVRHEYQDMARDFTCCVGSGMESHGLHGEGIYYEAGNRLWVNLYVPSTADWKSTGAKLAMETDFPEGESASLKLTLAKPKQLTLSFRRPSWAGEGFAIRVNGKAVILFSKPGSYIEITRSWKSGDVVSLTLPKTLHAEATPDNPNRVALMWGPLVLAGDLEPERRGAWTDPIPSFITAEHPVSDWLQPVAEQRGTFRSVGARMPTGVVKEVEFVPFYRLHRHEYALYWDLYSVDAWNKRLLENAAAMMKQGRLERATVSFLQPGDAQKEKDFNQQGEETTTDRLAGRTSRRAKKWFSFDLPIDAAHPIILMVTYHPEERSNRSFEILVDGQRIGEQTIDRSQPGSAAGHFFDVEYRIPAELLAGKQKVTVRFQAVGSNEVAAVYGVRLIRADAER